MKNIGKKTCSLLFIICTILCFLNDFSKKSINSIDDRRIIFENYAIWKKININYLASNILCFKNHIADYLLDQKKLVEENQKLTQNVKNLQEIAFMNRMFLQEKNKSIYDNFEFYPIQIKYNNKKFYGIAENENNLIERNDLIINYCGVIGKISHVGNKMAIIMLNNHPKFSLPITFENDKNNIGLYSFHKNKILEIKQKNSLSNGDTIITSRYKNKIPEGIFIGKIVNGDEQIIESKFCHNTSFGFVLKYKMKE